MPTLNWIGKDAVIRHHNDVPFRLLEPDEKLSHTDTKNPENGYDGNLIVQGDNLHALKALLPKYAGKVKCIYIDPPYNTGNVGWTYNDNVQSAEIKKWLGQVVGKEAEDLSRHDKWLCMMYPRLVLLKQFLSDDGAIFVSIDDNEVASLRFLMDEIFGRRTFIAQISWQKVHTLKNTAVQFSEMHDHIVVHADEGTEWRSKPLERTDKQNKAYKNPDKDSRGIWKATPLHARNHYDDGKYKITSPCENEFFPPSGTSWRFSESNFLRMEKEDRIWWGKDGNSIPSKKSFLSEVKGGVVPSTMWFHDEAGHNAEAKNELRDELGGLPEDLLTPKPSRLIQRILQIASDKDSIILDSFAGSGTTAQAVLKQNEADGGTRKFILVEMEDEIAKNITSERVRRVAGGYVNAKGEEVAGLGGGFQYCRLSEEPLFTEFGDIRDDVSFDQLADFVWFAETGIGYTEACDGAFLGADEGVGVYLLFNGILGDRKPEGGNILTHKVLESLPSFDGQRVIYAAASRIGQNALDRLGIIFKQTPYSIQV
jgi:adenine-specific DNA-methyltransferase